MGEYFPLLWRNVNAYRKETKCFKVVQTNALNTVKESTKCFRMFRITWSSHLLSTTYLCLLHSGIYDEFFKPCECLKLPAVIRNTASDRNCLIVYIWWTWKLTLHLLVLKRGNLFMRTATEFNISEIVVTKMIVCWLISLFVVFCSGCMTARSADGVFQLAILALLKTRQTLIVYHYCPPRLPAGKSKMTST